MKHIAAVTAQPGQQSWRADSRNSTPADDPAGINKKLVEYVFNRMQSSYGQMWTSRITSQEIFKVMVVDWGMALSRFDVATIDKAFERCRRGAHPKCPTLPEFVAECSASQPQRIHRALPRPPADKAKVASALVGLRRALGVG